MLITSLPNELILIIISMLNYIDILHLHSTSKLFNILINKNIYSIYRDLEKNSRELCWIPSYHHTKMWAKSFNYNIFLNIYKDSVKRKKRALIVIKYIYKWITNELIYPPMDRSAIPNSMSHAAHLYLSQMYPNINEYIDKEFTKFQYSYNFLKFVIEKYVSEDFLNFMDINRIHIKGFKIYERFNYNNPEIYVYNKNFTSEEKYIIKINKYDIRMFDVY